MKRVLALFVAVGAAAIISGCDDDTSATPATNDFAVGHVADMGKPNDLTPPQD
jgi:hypothetical protein